MYASFSPPYKIGLAHSYDLIKKAPKTQVFGAYDSE